MIDDLRDLFALFNEYPQTTIGVVFVLASAGGAVLSAVMGISRSRAPSAPPRNPVQSVERKSAVEHNLVQIGIAPVYHDLVTGNVYANIADLDHGGRERLTAWGVPPEREPHPVAFPAGESVGFPFVPAPPGWRG